MIKAILIDDEEIALKSLENKIKKNIPYIDIIFKTQDPQEGIKMINKLQPDLLFLDIDMPLISGFDVLAKVDAPNMEVIFVTAHFNYAITAIKHNAVDFILKPIDSDELITAVFRAKVSIEKKSAIESQLSLLKINKTNSSSIIIPTQKGLSFFKPNQIIRLEGDDGYTNIFTSEKQLILSSSNIGKFTLILANFNFFQTHKSHIINLEFIKAYHNDGLIELTNGDFVPLSKTRKKIFLEKIN